MSWDKVAIGWVALRAWNNDIWNVWVLNSSDARIDPATTQNLAAMETNQTDWTQVSQTKFAWYATDWFFMADAFWRFRTSSPYTLFDSKTLRDEAPLFYDDQEVSWSGTASAHQTNKASVKLSVSNTTAWKRVRQSKARGNYQPWKSQLVLMTTLCDICASGVKNNGDTLTLITDYDSRMMNELSDCFQEHIHLEVQ